MDNLFGGGDEYERRDGVTDFILNQARLIYGDSVTKEDIFYYVYGFLHLPAYRETFAADLKKSLPRIFLVNEPRKFWQLSKAGRQLAEIHLNYEKQPPADVEVVITAENYRVDKLKLSPDKKTLIYNADITIKNIPARAFEYVVNGRSPLEWIIDRYQVKKDSASGIVNNPNDWAIEHNQPRYILDLILSCITVSLKTLDIVEGLPGVDFT
jgi:predicted helicase